MSADSMGLEGPVAAPVATIIFADDPAGLSGVFDAVDGQVYEPGTRFVVGRSGAVRVVAEERGARHASTAAEALELIEGDVVHVWLLRAEARPRAGALGQLVEVSRRVDASVAGSKLLRLEEPELLESVGTATDVFAVPYSGLEPGEVDQQQYDVVRDVAVVSGASMLVRRDLLVGLGGPDRLLPPEAAAIDLCQRARLRGGRVVIAPSSEVLYPHDRANLPPPWREEAGRLRATLKAYSLLTLAWVLPFSFAIGLLEAATAPFLGRWTLFRWVRAWLWNVVHLGSTLRQRYRVRSGRTVGDEELFRYQVKGSARVRDLTEETGERLRRRFGTQSGGWPGLVVAGQETIQSPVFITGALVSLYVAVSTRSIWGGTLPAVGDTLPPSESAWTTLRAYGGGWNVGGLGSPEPLTPFVGAVALAQRLLFDRPELTATVLTVAAMAAGVLGMARLLRSWGVGSVAAYLAGIVLMGGPGAQAVAGRAQWSALLALGVVPWILRVSLRPWPGRLRGRVGRVAAIAWLTGVAAAGLPILIVLPAALLIVWAVVEEGGMGSVVRASAGAALAVPMLLPWFEVTDLSTYLEGGPPAFWNVSWPAVVLILVAAGTVIAGGHRASSRIATWGVAVAAGGLLLARTGSWDFGRDVASAGMVLAGLGIAAVTGVALDAAIRIEWGSGLRRLVTAVAIISGGGVLATAVLPLIPGRAGLPADIYRRELAFTEAQPSEPSMSRVFIAGPAADLPGDSRVLDGAAYRVISAPVPRLWEGRLGEPRLGDQELEKTLRSIIAGDVARAGEALAPFGIRWIVLLEPTPFASVFEGQLDLVELTGLSGTVFLSEAVAGRAVADDGTMWMWDPPDYRGPARSGVRVYVAENGDQRWGPGSWEQFDWGNSLGGDDGVITFTGSQRLRREAVAAGSIFAAMLGLSVWGTGRKST